MLVELRGLPSDSTCGLEAELGQLDIKRHKPGILFINCNLYQVNVQKSSLYER